MMVMQRQGNSLLVDYMPGTTRVVLDPQNKGGGGDGRGYSGKGTVMVDAENINAARIMLGVSERLVIEYGDHSNRTQDPVLKQLFRDIARKHQEVAEHLKGVINRG